MRLVWRGPVEDGPEFGSTLFRLDRARFYGLMFECHSRK
jgi:hypothetical protein